MRRFLLLIAAATVVATLPVQAQAQVEARVGKLESEMRAVQRKVFPGGAGQYIQPEITQPQAGPEPLPGVPASSPVIDLTQRVSALEQQMQSLTGETEQNGYRIRQLEDAFKAYQQATDAKLAAAQAAASAAAAPPAGSEAGTVAAPGDAGSFGSDNARPSDAPTRSPGANADPDRARQIAAVERPSTGDAAEDAYMYGYRLWMAKFYPEAEAQLKSVVAKYPKSKRASYAQNLLGRSYMDDGKPSLASIAFYDNYKKMPDGERAPDSLVYLGQALVQLKKPADACKVYDELNDVYGATLSAALKAKAAQGRSAAKCS